MANLCCWLDRASVASSILILAEPSSKENPQPGGGLRGMIIYLIRTARGVVEAKKLLISVGMNLLSFHRGGAPFLTFIAV